MKWDQLKRVFRKRRLKLINAIEYNKGGCLICTSKKLEMESEIMAENIYQFKLAYSSPIFNYEIIEYIEKYREIEEAQELIHNSTSIRIGNKSLLTFFQLFYQPNPMYVSYEISTE